MLILSPLVALPCVLTSPLPEDPAPKLADTSAAAAAKLRQPLMPWQRNLEDALALSKQTGKPLLVCVNADGEVASERLASNQYRDPRFVALVEGFIPVLASPARHRPRDFDDFGRRLEDPKFGRVVEAEHLDIEPIVYKRYFKNRRVAPRHVGVSPDGEILFDLFLLNNLGIIDTTLQQHGVYNDASVGGASGLEELLASHDHTDRLQLEARFLAAESAERVELLGQAFSSTRSAQHPQLLRLTFAQGTPAERQAAFDAVFAHPEAGIEFMLDAYRAVSGQPERQRELALRMAGVDLSGRTNVERLRLRRKIEVLAGLSAKPEALDPKRWTMALSLAPAKSAGAQAKDVDQLAEALNRIEDSLRAAPLDAELHQLHARGLLALAKLWIDEGGGNPTHVLTDAVQSAERALALRPDSPLAAAVLASASYLSSDLAGSQKAAKRALPELHAWASEELTSDVLALFAKLRAREVYSAYNSQLRMSAEAIADVCATYEVLLAHPLGTAQQAIDYLIFLDTIGATPREEPVVRRAIERFTDDGTLHGFLRHYVLRDRGAAGMESAYDGVEVAPEYELELAWYAALSMLVAAERHALEERLEPALTDYKKSIAAFERVQEENTEYAESSSHYIGMAHAGIARQLVDHRDLDGALAQLRAAVAASISCLGAKDGLGRIPKQTVAKLNTLLRRDGRDADADRFYNELKQLGVEL